MQVCRHIGFLVFNIIFGDACNFNDVLFAGPADLDNGSRLAAKSGFDIQIFKTIDDSGNLPQLHNGSII